jgi:general secretion pathway protein J
MPALRSRRRSRGFTLIEVLVALVIMAMMTVMAWRAVSALTNTRDHNEAHMDRAETLQTLMRQWELDLREVQDSKVITAVSFDGATLRLTRRRETGLQLVSWQIKDNRLTRWESTPTTERDALQDAWFRSQQLSAEELRGLPGVAGVMGWQIYFFRGNAWTNAQSEADQNRNTDGSTSQATPAGVRMRLQFGPDSGYRGELNRQVLVPAGGGK